MRTASGTLISALKSSLADSTAGWAVTAVQETSATRLSDVSGSVTGETHGETTGSISGSTSGSIVAGAGDVTGSTTGSVTGYVTGSVSGSTSSTSTTVVKTAVTLAAAGIPAAVGAPTSLALAYTSIWTDGAFSGGVIQWQGAELASADAVLDSTIRTLASTYVAGRDTALAAVLGAGPQAGLSIPADLLAAIKTSLADTAAGWHVRSHVVNPIGPATDRQVQHTIGLGSELLRIPVAGNLMRGQLTYIATVSALGALIEARVLLNGAEWRSTDTALNSTILAAASDFTSAQATTVTGALNG